MKHCDPPHLPGQLAARPTWSHCDRNISAWHLGQTQEPCNHSHDRPALVALDHVGPNSEIPLQTVSRCQNLGKPHATVGGTPTCSVKSKSPMSIPSLSVPKSELHLRLWCVALSMGVSAIAGHSQSKPCREDSSAFVAMTPLLQHRLRLHKIGLALAYVNQRNISTTGLLEEYSIKTPPWKHSQRCNSDLGSCSHDFRDGQELPFSCQEIAHHTSYYVITLCMQLEMSYCIFDSQRSWTAFLTLRY